MSCRASLLLDLDSRHSSYNMFTDREISCDQEVTSFWIVKQIIYKTCWKTLLATVQAYQGLMQPQNHAAGEVMESRRSQKSVTLQRCHGMRIRFHICIREMGSSSPWVQPALKVLGRGAFATYYETYQNSSLNISYLLAHNKTFNPLIFSSMSYLEKRLSTDSFDTASGNLLLW